MARRVFRSLLAGFAALALASSARAEDAASPSPGVGPGAHLHDGFYLRMALGYGPLNVTESVANTSVETKLKGNGTAFELIIGGSPTPGLAIGGSLFTHAIKPKIETATGSVESTKSIFVLSLGPMVDWFPSATGGFHVGGGVGWGTLNAVNYTSTGTAFHLFTGYDFWIGNEWSLGPALRLTSSRTSKEPFEDSATSIVLMISVLDH